MTSTPDAPVRTVSLAVGEVVGEAANSWKVLRHIAEGGFSSVYAVRPATPETQEAYGADDRALKCLRGTDSRSAPSTAYTWATVGSSRPWSPTGGCLR